MLSSTAAQVRIHPRMIQPKYGNIGDDHGASRSRRITTPRFTALSATIAKAIVIEIDAWSVLGVSGPHCNAASARPAMMKPLISQRITWGRVTILVPGLRGGRCITLGIGDVGDEPDDDGDDDEELAEQQLHREQRHAAVDVEDRREEHQLQHRRQHRQLQLHVRRDAPVDVAAEVDRAHERGEVVVGEHDLAGLLRDLGAAAHGDADVGLLERGGIVDRVAGHRHDLAGLLHQPGEADLVLGCDPAEHVQLREAFDHLGVGQLLEIGAGDEPGPELELVGDRAGGDGVVAGDHAHVDPGVERDAHRVAWPRRATGR